MNPSRSLFVTIAGALALTACSALVRRENITVYSPALEPAAQGSMAHGVRPWQLSIAEPRAIAPLSGARIVVMPVAGEMQTYKGVRWRDTSPVLIQQLLLQSFQESAGLGGVGLPTTVMHADLTLQSNLLDFQAEYRGARVPTVVIRLNAHLVDNSTGLAAANRTFAVEQPCTGTAAPEVFAAFQDALNRMLPQVAGWALEAGDAAWSAKASGK